MQKELDCRSLILPFVISVVLGITAKLVDVPYITCDFPIFDDIMRRFGIWVWAAALIAVRCKTPLLAAARSFAFFIGMLSAYYGYTVLVLKFFPGSQIASLPFILLIIEWDLTVFTDGYYTVQDKLLLFIVYLCMALSLLAAIPAKKKRLFSLVYGSLISLVLILLIQTGTIVNLYGKLLNI